MGGAAGHMDHPFDIPGVKTGNDLKKFFLDAAEYLNTKPASVKIDGVNVSFKLIERDGQKEFAADRGSLKPIDIEGITIDRVSERYAEGHGMIPATRVLLKIFNEAIPRIKPELQELGMWDDPTVFLNTEYVSETTNVTEYDHNFLAIHGVNQFYQKTHSRTGNMRPGLERPAGVKAPSTEISYDQKVLELLSEKVNPIAEKYNFKIYTSVPTNKEPDSEPFDFNEVLTTSLTLVPDARPITMSLGEWLEKAENPKNTTLKTSDGRTVESLNKQIYMAALKGDPIAPMLADPTEENLLKAVNGVIVYHATRLLGNEILRKLTSPMGAISNHEGVVIRDEMFGPRPVKITGEFIVGGVGSAFRENNNPLTEEDEDPYAYRDDMEQWERDQYYKELEEDEGKTIALFPGKFKPPHAGHFAAAKYYADNPEVEEVRVIISRNQKVEHGPNERLVVTPDMSQAIWDIYAADEPKIKVWVTNAPTPVRDAYDEISALNPGDTVMMVIGDKDVKLGDTRYDAVPAYAQKQGVNYELDPVKEEDTNVPEDLSATEMRRYILAGKKEAFFAQLPPKLSPEQKESIFNLLQSGIQKKTNESISSLADIRRLVEEVVNEVESEKQRRWACAQLGDDFKGDKKLNKDQAEEMCTAEVEEGLRDFFRGEASAEKAMDQAWLLKLASEKDKYLKLSTADRNEVAQLLAVTPERLNQLATSQKKMYYAPIDAGIEPWILVRQKMAQIQKKLFDTEEPLSFSDASELEELSSMGGGSVEGGGVAKQDTGALNSKKRKKKRDTLIREDGEQFINEVLNYILSSERK